MKHSIGNILIKLIAIVVFLGGLGGGGYLAVNAVSGETDDWPRFFIGIGMALGAIFVIGLLVPWIARSDGRADWEAEEGSVNLLTSLVVGLIGLFAGAFLIFLAVGLIFWVTRGWWQLGLSSIANFMFMLCIAIEVSIRWQMRGSAKARKDKHAGEYLGKVIAITPQFGFILIRSSYFICKYTVEIDGIKSTAFLRRSSKTAKKIFQGDTVNVKFNPHDPRYCAITGIPTL